MSTPIIIGGDRARQSVGELEVAAMDRCEDWRTRAENLMKQFTSDCSAMCAEEE